jgi:hypothetical protein
LSEALEYTRDELVGAIHERSLARMSALRRHAVAAQSASDRDYKVSRAENDVLVAELDYLEFRLREGLYSETPKKSEKEKPNVRSDGTGTGAAE